MHPGKLFKHLCCCCCSVTNWCPALCDPMGCSTPMSVTSLSLSLFPRVCSNSCLLSLWCYLTISSSATLFLPSTFPSIRIFFNKSAFRVRWPKYWSFSFSISPSSEYSGLIPFRIDLFNLQFKGLSSIFSSIFSSTTIQKHQFFNTKPSLWSNSHIHTWLLEKPWLWLCGPLSVKWCLCFLTCCLGLS